MAPSGHQSDDSGPLYIVIRMTTDEMFAAVIRGVLVSDESLNAPAGLTGPKFMVSTERVTQECGLSHHQQCLSVTSHSFMNLIVIFDTIMNTDTETH